MDINVIAVNIKGWLANIQFKYDVNPYVFAFLYFLGVAPFWFSLYRVIRCLKDKEMHKLPKWIIIYLLSITLPFLYVALFGKNLPVLFWAVIGIFTVFSVWSGYKKVRKKALITTEHADCSKTP